MQVNCYWFLSALLLVLSITAQAQIVPAVEQQPLTAQIRRISETLDYLGAALSPHEKQQLEQAANLDDAAQFSRTIQTVLDAHALFLVHINAESRVRVTQGAAKPVLVANGWRTFLVKVHNEAGVTAPLQVISQNALRVWSRGPRGFSDTPRPPQTITARDVRDRWLDVSLYNKAPMTAHLSGLNLEYRVIQLYSRDVGKREARFGFNVGQGTQDIGYRNEADILFTCQPSATLTLRVQDEAGRPTTASFVIRDKQGHIYPSPAKRLAPDFPFHPQIYRADGETILLPAGEYEIEFARGPESIVQKQTLRVTSARQQTFSFQVMRWIDPAKFGWYSGDHHIHAAGCMHYETPSEGVKPQDMMRHILGEDLKVGSVLTWGPCYYYQKQFFEAKDNKLSTPENLMRYDVEISGFPSSQNGHLVLLRLKDQNYPGTKVIEDWPSWDLPILQWAKSQGAVVGFAHSGWGLDAGTDKLPNYELPLFGGMYGGIGANEYIVDVTHDAVDFISAVDTPPAWELNIWYHTLNSGFRTRISGETDFPCIYGERVGLGRSYVKLVDKLTYEAWVDGIRTGKAYVSDGKSHLLDFRVNDVAMGTNNSEVKLADAATVHVTATVSALLNEQANETLRRAKHDAQPYWDIERARIGDTRTVPVELIVNGLPVAQKNIVANGNLQEVSFDVKIAHSSWVALRTLPSSHTNPIFVLVAGKPVRASRKSAEWCLQSVDKCWEQKVNQIAEKERAAAAQAYAHARAVYRQIIAESPLP